MIFSLVTGRSFGILSGRLTLHPASTVVKLFLTISSCLVQGTCWHAGPFHGTRGEGFLHRALDVTWRYSKKKGDLFDGRSSQERWPPDHCVTHIWRRHYFLALHLLRHRSGSKW